MLSAALAAWMALGGLPAAAGQITKDQKAAAAAAQANAQGGSVPLRVMLVISDAVRAYRVRNRLVFATFGRSLANQTEKLFTRNFAGTKYQPTLPGPFPVDGVDLVVILEVPHGTYHSNGEISLSAGFEVRDAKGEEILHAQEEAEGNISNDGVEQLGRSVVLDFLQKLSLNERVQAMLALPPAASAEVKPVTANTSLMDSSGLDVPPPPPWATSKPAAIATPSGRP
jgi:hypothetical protein